MIGERSLSEIGKEMTVGDKVRVSRRYDKIKSMRMLWGEMRHVK